MIVATPVHAGAMAALHAAAFPGDAWPAESFATLLAQPGAVGLLDERGGMVLLRVVADEAEILTIGVASPRRGLGRGLMLEAITTARTAGATTMFLEVAAGNEAALGLYKALGFAAAGGRRGYYANGEDAVLLRLDLIGAEAAPG